MPGFMLPTPSQIEAKAKVHQRLMVEEFQQYGEAYFWKRREIDARYTLANAQKECEQISHFEWTLQMLLIGEMGLRYYREWLETEHDKQIIRQLTNLKLDFEEREYATDDD